MINYREKLFPEKYYHIFNHAVGKEILFRNDENYNFFLKKYNFYISSVADTYAYCLMPNHYHFLMKFKSYKEIIRISEEDESESKLLRKNIHKYFNNNKSFVSFHDLKKSKKFAIDMELSY